MMFSRLKKQITLILALGLTLAVLAQDPVLHFGNLRRPWRGNNAILDSVWKKYKPDSKKIIYRIPLTFWLYVDKNGFGPGPLMVKQQVKTLNKFFNQYNNTGIYFYVASINIVQRRKSKIGYLWGNLWLTSKNKVKGTINIHIVNQLQLNMLLERKEFGGTYNAITNALIITKANFPTGLTHEMGHYFGLLHPHRHWRWGRLGAEAVSRSKRTITGKLNCEVRGDFICDTQAQPDLSLFTSDDCTYLGNITDPWGQPYHPQTDNIMSYFRNKRCRKHFTKGQIAAMLLWLEQNPYAHAWRNNEQNAYFQPDQYEPDQFPLLATYLPPNKPQYHTFNPIFTAKDLMWDKVDFVKFYVNDFNQKIFLRLKPGKHNFPEMKISILDRFFVPIKSYYLTGPTVIHLPSLTPNVYYLRIEPMNLTKQQTLYDYWLKLEILP